MAALPGRRMLHSGLLILGAATLVGWLALAVDAARGQRQVLQLHREPLPSSVQRAGMPAVSLIVAARNEELHLERALRSVLALEYPRLEIVAIDDRSDDATGAILDRLAEGDPRLRVIHVRKLPPGWLGKNHALHLGAELAGGELLLFTDADVWFDPSVLLRAVPALQRDDIDHLTVPGDVHPPTLGVELFVATFALFFNAYFRPWRAADPESSAYIGFGAFNLVGAESYRRAGGHAALAMEPLDDVLLGRLLKRAGARQRLALAGPMISVEWYPDLPAAIRGLEKNTLAGANWSLPLLLAGAATQLATVVWPSVAPWVSSGPLRWLNLGIVLVVVSMQLTMLRDTSLRSWTSLLLPVGVLLVVYTGLRAAALTLWRGGIYWRGTFYPLSELRRPR